MAADPHPAVWARLALRCQAGESAAFDELIAQWESRLYYYIRRLVPQEQDAWQLLQETWLRLFQNIRQLRDPERLVPWMFGIARNTVCHHHRQVWKELQDVPLTEEFTTSADETDSTSRDSAEEVHAALALLGLSDRELLTLCYLRELSLQDIAEVLRIPRGTVKSRLFLARTRLREILEQRRGQHE